MLVKKFKVLNAVYRIDEKGNKVYPKEKKYYLLLMFNNKKDEKTFELFDNRKDVYDYIEANLYEMNILQSQVLTDTHTIQNCISVYSFAVGYRDVYSALDKDFELSSEELDEYALQCAAELKGDKQTVEEKLQEVIDEDGVINHG